MDNRDLRLIEAIAGIIAVVIGTLSLVGVVLWLLTVLVGEEAAGGIFLLWFIGSAARTWWLLRRNRLAREQRERDEARPY